MTTARCAVRSSAVRAALVALALLAGCRLPFYVPGGYDECMPRLYEPIREGASVWVERPAGEASRSIYSRREHALVDEFEKAFEAHGAKRPGKKADADVVVTLKVLAWEYNEVGFSGVRARDHIELAVTLTDPKTKRVLQRASVQVASDFRIIGKYVDSLYKR